MPMDFTKMNDQELLKMYQEAKAARSGQQQPQQPQLVSQGLIPDVLNKISPVLGATVGQFARGAQANYGKQPTSPDNDLSKFYAQEMFKKQMEDPTEARLKQENLQSQIEARRAGYTIDENGNPIKTVNPLQDAREQRLKTFESRRQAGTLRGELNQNDYIKRFQPMHSAVSGLDSILQDTLSRPDLKSKNIGDQALITLYNKILDPLSVVRESEYARTPEGLSLMNRIQGFVQKVEAGGSGLTDQDRIEIARAAKILVNNSGDLYNQKIDEYSNLADQYEVDPNLVIGGFQRFSPYDVNKEYQIPGNPQSSQPSQPQQQVGVPEVGGMFQGEKIRKVTKIG